MKKEIQVGCDWWTSNMNKEDLTPEQVQSFTKNLVSILTKKYTEHWHGSNPEQGSAFRSILFDSFCCDPVLRRALDLAGISPTRRFPSSAVVMFIGRLAKPPSADPGHVAVQSLASNSYRVLFSIESSSGSNSPATVVVGSDAQSCAAEVSRATLSPAAVSYVGSQRV